MRTNVPCLVEFPPTCEVRVNSVQLTANLKGLKKKPGTAPPPDIGKHCRFTAIPNKVEMVYVNSQQAVQPKVSIDFTLTQVSSIENRNAEILSCCDACRSQSGRLAFV